MKASHQKLSKQLPNLSGGARGPRLLRRACLLGSCITTTVLFLTVLPAPAAPAGTPPLPRGKSGAESDLTNYPKLPVSRGDVPTVAPESSGVVTSTQRPDGTTVATEYTPAPGVSNQELYDQLRASGVRDLQDPSSRAATPNGATAFSSTTCTYGSAKTLACPPVHWANNGHSHPQVYFVDHTSSLWPVDVATYKWNQAQGIDSWYRWATCPGYSGTHCVSLTDASYPGAPWVGLATVVYNSTTRNIVDGQTKIVFNDAKNSTTNAAGHRQAACQEIGHTLGLDHSSSTSSCMYATIRNSTATIYPSSNDFTLLASIYSVAH